VQQTSTITGNGQKDYSQKLRDFDTNSGGAVDKSLQESTVTGNDNAVNQELQTQNENDNGAQVYNHQGLTINGNNNDANEELNVQQTNNGGVVTNEQVHTMNGDGGVLDDDQPTSRLLRGCD